MAGQMHNTLRTVSEHTTLIINVTRCDDRLRW